MCLDRSAEALKDFAPWKAWIQAIRNYGSQESDALGEKEEALMLAQAMEDHGCGFLANLSAQNISLGGCFKWSNKFDWEFKTVEYFCPVTCGCTKDTSDETSCPKPFGKDCDELNNCLTWNEQHFCPGYNAEVIDFAIQYTLASPQAWNFLMGIEHSFSCRLFLYRLVSSRA